MSAGCLTSDNGNIGVMWKTVSEACNLACDYCYYSRCGGKPGRIDRIDDAVLEKFIKEYMELSNGVAKFAWQGGEPLLAGLDFFERIVELQAKYAPPNTMISNSLQTNGTLINDEWARFLKQYNFLVGVSLDGPKEINDSRRVTGSGAGSYDRVMRGIASLRNYDVDFNILTVILEGNVTEARELMEFYKQEKFSFVQFIPGMDFRAQETDAKGEYLITPAEYGNFLCEAFDVWYNDGEPVTSVRFFDNMLNVYVHREAELCIHRKSCPKTLILEQNGDAYPCDFFINDKYKLGNVGSDNLTDILNSPLYDEFLKLKPNLPKQCLSCKYINLCHGGCPRNRTWSFGEDETLVDVDYFCQSYKQIYSYAHDRMEIVAQNVKRRWLQEYIETGLKLPDRNDTCVCGSGKKFKKCCEPLKAVSTSNK
ncbi:anaerobic sulfatase maturase [Bacillus sp. FJAT-18017]|uniref:anaerobic sulfatase maturase n=1 Tax=Bacillus sp. FJAT-18017 TaxID=1705566 RepID=UPI0006AEE59F|nr:anaerobic sulfatase maturase [Bacillus sp. FJAT-18017]ALC91416.1 anaerobic sulfatase maturase [Bacillus sp. FJAT-18017]